MEKAPSLSDPGLLIANKSKLLSLIRKVTYTEAQSWFHNGNNNALSRKDFDHLATPLVSSGGIVKLKEGRRELIALFWSN